MKLAITFTLILVVFNSQAQNPPEFFKTNNNLKKWFIPSTTKEISQVVNTLKTDKTFDWYFYNLEQGDVSVTDYFHFLDFNADGINDLIYQGLLGGESMFIVLLKGNGNNYEKELVLSGKIFWTNSPGHGEALRFRLYNYACCMGRVDFIEYYEPFFCRDTFKFILGNREAFINETKFPKKKLLRPISFVTVNNEYKLRLTPEIDNDTQYWGTDEKGNDIATFPKGSLGIALAESIDSTGRIWWFVKMLNNKNNTGMFIDGDNSDEPYHCYGWMSSRYLKKLE